eukprot:Skav200721  [mRNA]  locus=scaffold1362:1608:2763:- [translate_table: standard]
MNHAFLLPLVKCYPSKVPSAYLLTDVFLRLDAQLEKKVFRPTRQNSRTSLAANEGVKAKRLFGSLRALWRSSPGKGQDAKITELKSFLQASPKPMQPVADGVEPEADLLPEAAAPADHHLDADAEDVPVEGRDGDDDDDAKSGGSADEASGSEESAGDKDDGDVDGSPLSASQETDDAQGTPSTLKASTLRLGFHAEASQESVSSSESESGEARSPAASGHGSIPDEDDEKKEEPPRASFPLNAFEAGESQVPGGGWMGQSIANFNSKDFARKYKETIDFHYNQLMGLVKDSLAFQLGEECVEGDLWNLFDKWCREAFAEYGDIVFEDVIKGEFFRAWARRLKSKARL